MADLAETLNGLTAITNGAPTDPAIPPAPRKRIDPLTTLVGSDWANMAGTVIPRMGAGIASMPFDLYNLAGKAADWATGSDNVLPGAQGAAEISDTIHDPVNKFVQDTTGAPINESLISGTAPELAASWMSLAGMGVLRAPLAVARTVEQGINAVNTGNKVVDTTAKAALGTLEALSPVLMRNPTAPVVAANVAVPAAIGVGLEMLFPPDKPAKLDDAAKQGADIAITGAEHAAPAVAETQAATNPVQASFSTGNPWIDGTLITLGAGFAFAAMKRDVAKRLLAGMGQGESSVLDTSTALRSNVVDRTAPMKDFYRTTQEEAGNANAASISDRMANRIDESNGSAVNTKLNSVYQYGEIPNSAVKMPSISDFYLKLRPLDPATKQSIADAANDSRANWTNLPANSPARAAVMELDSIAQKLVDYTVEQRFNSPRAGLDMKKLNTHEILTSLSDGDSIVKSALKAGDPMPGDVLSDLPRYIEKTIRNVEWNKQQRTWIQFMRNAEDAGVKGVDEVLGRRDISSTTHIADKVVSYRDANGIRRTQEIKDPLILRALKTGDDMSRLHMLAGASAKLARGFEQSATGVVATALGQPFAHIAALYNAVFGSAIRERGTAVGYADKALQSMGFKFGLPGDPTVIADSAFRALQGVSAVGAKRLADSLHNSIVSGGVLSNVMSPAGANKVGAALANHYKRSWVYAFQQQGLLGPAAFEGINADKSIKYVQSRLTSANVPVNAVRDTYRFVGDILHAISASPGASVYALNKNLAPELRARAVREFTGDTARSGAFVGKLREGSGPGELLGKLTTATPWGNVYLQSMDKFARSLSTPQKALSTAVGMTTAVGIPVVSAAMWNASLGPEYSDHHYNVRSPDRQAGSIYVGLPGLHPEHGLEIPVDPLMRPFKLAMELLAGHHLGLMDGSLFHPDNEGQKVALTEMVRNRWLTAGKDSVATSVFNQAVMPPPATAVGLGGALLGHNVRGYNDISEIHKRTDTGFSESDARDPTRTLLGMPESANMEQIVRSIGANSVTMAYNLWMDSAKRMDEGSPVLRNAVQTLKLGASDSAKQVSGLFGSFQPISSSQEAAGQLASAKVKGLQELNKAFQAVTSSGALTDGSIVGNKQRGFQELLGGKVAIAPNDPRMIQLGQYAGMYLHQIQNQFLGANKDDYEKRASYQIATDLSPERKRSLMNLTSNEIIQRNRQLLELLHQFEAAVSTTLGVPVRLDKIKPGSDADAQGGE